MLDLSTNQLPSLDLSTNVALAQISLLANSLTTVSIGQILDDVDAYGTGSFGYILDLRGNPGDIPAGCCPLSSGSARLERHEILPYQKNQRSRP